MSMTFTKGSVNVTGTISATSVPAIPVAGVGQSIINIFGTGNGSNQNSYTVTAGKTFYLYSYFTSSTSSGLTIYKNDGTTILGQHLTNTADTAGGINSAVPIWAYTAGQNVVAKCTNGKAYHIWGVEQ